MRRVGSPAGPGADARLQASAVTLVSKTSHHMTLHTNISKSCTSHYDRYLCLMHVFCLPESCVLDPDCSEDVGSQSEDAVALKGVSGQMLLRLLNLASRRPRPF